MMIETVIYTRATYWPINQRVTWLGWFGDWYKGAPKSTVIAIRAKACSL